MGRVVLYITGILLAFSALAVTVPSPSKIPKLYYRIPKAKKLENKDYLTIKSDDFVILAKRQEEKDDHIYWKTVKIRVKNQAAIESWPYGIKQLMAPLTQDKTPKEPFLGVSLYASPISFAVLNKARNIYAGYSIRTISASKHELTHDLSINETYQKDESYGTETSSLVLNSSLIYDYNNFYDKWTYFAIANYRRQKFNGDYPIKHQYGLGVLGLKYKFIKNGTYIKNLDMSYVPIYEELISDFEVQYPGEVPSKTQKDIRHSFRFRFNIAYTDWNLNYVLFYRPAYYFKINTLDMQDIDLNSTLTIGKTLSEKVQLNFTNVYTRDIRLFRANGMRPENSINSFSINVALNI
jgi:hypothetical protein